MKPTTQKLLLIALAVISLGTTGLVLVRGAIESARHDPQYHAHDPRHGTHADHAHHHHHGPAAIVENTVADTPDQFGPMPAFDLIDQDAKAVSPDTFKGKAIIGCFIFTRCNGPCPVISLQMANLQKRLADHPQRDRIHQVSFSVDPTHDTPAVLTEYARQFDADTTRWSFLTGDRAGMWKLVTEGFRLALQDTPDDVVSPIAHSTKLVLIDPAGHLRGYYDALDADSRELMLKHLDYILKEFPAGGHAHAHASQAGESK